jgi:acyl carrier protein
MELDVLRDILVRILGVAPDEITLDTTFAGDLGADSLDMYQVVMQMEKTFQVEVIPEKLREIQTVAEALEYIETVKKEK